MVLAVLGVHAGNMVVVAGQAANGARPREQSSAARLFGVVTQVHHRQLRDRLQDTHRSHIHTHTPVTHTHTPVSL